MSSGDPIYNILVVAVAGGIIGLIIGSIKWLFKKLSSKTHPQFKGSRFEPDKITPHVPGNLPLVFKGTQEAFEYCCKFMDCQLTVGRTLPALVVDAQEIAGTNTKVKRRNDGVQIAMLRVPSRDGGFLVLSETVSSDAPNLHAGDLVAWYIGGYNSEVGQVGDDNRLGWVGLIVGRLEPKLEIKDGTSEWKVAEFFQ